MKRNPRCTKCQGDKIWVVEAFRVPTDTAQGQVLAVATQEEAGKSFLGIARAVAVGQFDLYVCAKCGYSELWARDIEELREDPAKGVRLLDGGARPGGPFR